MSEPTETNALTMELAVAYYTPLGWALEDGEEADPDDLAECLRAMLPVASVVRDLLARAWDRGASAALSHAVRNDDGITLRLDRANPYRQCLCDAFDYEAEGPCLIPGHDSRAPLSNAPAEDNHPTTDTQQGERA